jgi:diguanylate cyclase (GGDEF)-like protein
LSAALDSNAPPSTIECRLLTAAGASRWVEGRCTALRAPDGRVLEIEGLWLDISERKATEQHIAQLVRTDVLTGLANRASFADRLRQTFAAARRGAHAFAVLYLDLDRFKEVNDTLGHAAGDKLLQQVAARLRSCTREIDAIARIGGDEFAILQHEVNDYPVAGRLAEKLIEAVSAPYRIDGNDVRIGASVGISLYDGQTPDCETLLVQADQALYRSKESGRGQYRFFSDALDQDAHAQLTLAEELRRALVQQQLELRYQPQVELVSGRIVGMEASLRWNHPVRGPLLPEDILPVAEKFGVMQPLGRWMLDDACRQGALWRKEGMQAPVIALSITLAQIKMGAEFLRDVAGSLERWNLAPGDLEFAVTEQVLALATRSKSNVLDALRRLGIGIAIVDFGAQYSSLDYLRHYGVKRLRIARGMVAAATAEPGGSAMIRAIQGLAGALGVAVVAEGVETEEQRELLAHASAGAQGQGFYFSGAVAAEDTVRLLRAGIVPPENAAQIADDP